MIGAFPLKLLASEKIANKRLRWIRGPKPHAVEGDVRLLYRPECRLRVGLQRSHKTIKPSQACALIFYVARRGSYSVSNWVLWFDGLGPLIESQSCITLTGGTPEPVSLQYRFLFESEKGVKDCRLGR
jgi:hypothetical protein